MEFQIFHFYSAETLFRSLLSIRSQIDQEFTAPIVLSLFGSCIFWQLDDGTQFLDEGWLTQSEAINEHSSGLSIYLSALPMPTDVPLGGTT